MREISLVGAIHCVSIPGLMEERHIEVEPPEDFELSVAGLDSDARVAIEGSFVGDPPPILPHISLRSPCDKFPGSYLFRTLHTRLDESVQEVIPIDDYYYSRILLPEFNDRMHEFKDTAYLNGGLSPRQSRAAWHITVMFNHINANLREDRMFERIAESSADVVIMGQAHADVLVSDEELQEKLGVEVADYIHLNPIAPFDPHPYHQDSFPSEIVRPDPEKVTLAAKGHKIERELARRRYNAFAIGRVLGRKESEPDYLGRFYISESAANSLFELTVEDRMRPMFTGSIKDIHGDASVMGIIDRDGMNFEKTYNLATVGPHAYSPLRYESTFDTETGQYRGRWAPLDDEVRSGAIFTVVPFSKGAIWKLDKNNPGFVRTQ